MVMKRKGFTLIELVITVAIFLIVTVVGFGMTRDTLPRWRAHKAAEMFAGHVHMCRMIAIETGYECRILMSDYDDSPLTISAGNAGHYYVQLGDSSLNADTYDTLPTSLVSEEGDFDISEGSTNYLRNVSILEWDTISGPTASGSNTIVFSPRGFVTNPADDFNDGYITISFANKLAYAKGIDDVYQVQIARSGMTRTENPLMGGPFASGTPGTNPTSTSD